MAVKEKDKGIYISNNIKVIVEGLRAQGYGITIAAMADMTGIKQRTLYLYYNNEVEPSAANLLAIAEYLEVHPDRLINRKKVK